MTRQEMQNKLDRKDISGVGVKVTFDFSSGETGTTYYFYEDFEDDKGVDRAARQGQDHDSFCQTARTLRCFTAW